MRTIERKFRLGEFLDEVYHLLRIQRIPCFDSRFACKCYQGVVDRVWDLYVGMGCFGKFVKQIGDGLRGRRGSATVMESHELG